MNENDKIYDLFQRNAHKLEEKPSKRAWERLETKLDSKKPRARGGLWLKYSGVAAAIAIVMAAITFMNPWDAKEKTQFAALERPNATLLDFDIQSNQVSYLKMVAYQKEYDKLNKRLAEAETGALKPKESEHHISTTSSAERPVIASIDIKKKKTKPSSSPKANNIAKSKANNAAYVERPQVKKKRMSPVTTEPTKVQENVVKEEIVAETTPQTLPQNDEMAMDVASVEATGIKQAEMEAPIATTSSQNIVAKAKSNQPVAQGLDAFLQGTTWKKVTASSYQGQATSSDGVSKDIRLETSAAGTYLMIDVDGKPISYLMTSQKNGTAIFKNKAITAHPIITLQKQGGKVVLVW